VLRLKLERSVEEGGGWERRALPLAPRSAYILDGEARELWLHSIRPGESLRYSITFRTLRERAGGRRKREGGAA
jgi:alkylated DNA repair dioxygenase AlkB